MHGFVFKGKSTSCTSYSVPPSTVWVLFCNIEMLLFFEGCQEKQSSPMLSQQIWDDRESSEKIKQKYNLTFTIVHPPPSASLSLKTQGCGAAGPTGFFCERETSCTYPHSGITRQEAFHYALLLSFCLVIFLFLFFLFCPFVIFCFSVLSFYLLFFCFVIFFRFDLGHPGNTLKCNKNYASIITYTKCR